MTPDTALAIGQQVLIVTTLLAAPLLLSALAVGLLIGILQAATQINEMTLTFIPKLMAVAAALMLAGPWMMRVLLGFAERLFHDIPTLIG